MQLAIFWEKSRWERLCVPNFWKRPVLVTTKWRKSLSRGLAVADYLLEEDPPRCQEDPVRNPRALTHLLSIPAAAQLPPKVIDQFSNELFKKLSITSKQDPLSRTHTQMFISLVFQLQVWKSLLLSRFLYYLPHVIKQVAIVFCHHGLF